MPMRSLAFSTLPRRTPRIALVERSRVISVPPVLALGVSWARDESIARDAAKAPATDFKFRFIKIVLPCFDFLRGEPSLTRGLQLRPGPCALAIGDYPDAHFLSSSGDRKVTTGAEIRSFRAAWFRDG